MIRSSRRLAAAIAVILTLPAIALLGCSSSDPTTTPTTLGATSTVAPDSTIVHLPAGPVDPAFVPVNFLPLSGAALDVAVAVPGSWQITTVDGDDVTSGGATLSRVDPQLGGLIRQVGGYLGNAAVVAAIDRVVGTQGRATMLVQSRVAVATVPAAMVSQVQTWLESIGAADIRTQRIAVPGLAADTQSVRIDAVIRSGASTSPLVVVLVPATRGIAVVVVRSPLPAANGILNTLAAR